MVEWENRYPKKGDKLYINDGQESYCTTERGATEALITDFVSTYDHSGMTGVLHATASYVDKNGNATRKVRFAFDERGVWWRE